MWRESRQLLRREVNAKGAVKMVDSTKEEDDLQRRERDQRISKPSLENRRH